MNVAILGTDQSSQVVAQIIEQHYNLWLEQRLGEKLNVAAFVTEDGGIKVSNIGNVPILNPVQFALLYHKKLIDKIIFPRRMPRSLQRLLLPYLLLLGVRFEDIFLVIRLKGNINTQDFLKPYLSAKYLPYLEFHIADHCNLNCKYCAHFAGLVKESKFPVFEKFTQDFQQLKKFIDDIETIRIMGGEPLLNPEVNNYLEFTRKIYPEAIIRLVTNATLLQGMPEDFFEALREFNVGIDISFYPPMKNKMPKVFQFLKEKNIDVQIGNLAETFFLRLSLKKQKCSPEEFFKCNSVVCNFFFDGKISVCPETAMTKYFNEYYNKNLPQDGIIDLYEKDLTTEKLKARLWQPFERCNYCHKRVHKKWEPVKYPSPLSDWIID